MEIVLICNREWYVYLPTVLSSILWNNQFAHVSVFAEDDEIDSIKDSRVSLINTTEQTWLHKEPNYRGYFPLHSGGSAYVTKYICGDRAIFLDTDIIVDGSLQELWDTDFGDNYLAAVIEPVLTYQRGYQYINQGVMLMDLERMRQDKIDDAMIDMLNTTQLMYANQDAWNIICKDRIFPIDNKYNSNRFCGVSPNPVIYHTAGQPKIWSSTNKFHDLWDKYYVERMDVGK